MNWLWDNQIETVYSEPGASIYLSDLGRAQGPAVQPAGNIAKWPSTQGLFLWVSTWVAQENHLRRFKNYCA